MMTDSATEVTRPDNFICPISFDLMTDPLVSIYGHHYQKEAILGWLNEGNSTCPLTRELLTLGMLFSDRRLQSNIKEWMLQNGLAVQHYNEHEDAERVVGLGCVLAPTNQQLRTHRSWGKLDPSLCVDLFDLFVADHNLFYRLVIMCTLKFISSMSVIIGSNKLASIVVLMAKSKRLGGGQIEYDCFYYRICCTHSTRWNLDTSRPNIIHPCSRHLVLANFLKAATGFASINFWCCLSDKDFEFLSSSLVLGPEDCELESCESMGHSLIIILVQEMLRRRLDPFQSDPISSTRPPAFLWCSRTLLLKL